MTKKELKQALQEYDENRSEIYINHDIFMLDIASWNVYNIGG